MTAFILLLALHTLALTALPCCPCEPATAWSEKASNEGTADNCAPNEVCSPFSLCRACPGFVGLVEHLDAAHRTSSVLQRQGHSATIISPYLHSIWHPPKRVA